MLDRPQFDLTAHAVAGVLEDLHGVELEGVVEDGIEDENAPGLHVGDGLERLNGKPLGHAANELVASDGPDGIAGGLGFLDWQRELEAPFEHHLENDIEFSTVRFYHVEHKLTRLGPLNPGVVKSKHAEADIRKFLGLFAEFALRIFFFDFGLNLFAGTTYAFFTDLSTVVVQMKTV